MNWKPETFDIAMPHGPEPRAGYVYRGLGIHQKAAPKGSHSAQWTLTHLGSGHAIGLLFGSVSEAFPIATEVAEAGDWTFDGMKGWENQFPDAGDRLKEILAKYPKRFKREGGGESYEGVAREIAMKRAAA